MQIVKNIEYNCASNERNREILLSTLEELTNRDKQVEITVHIEQREIGCFRGYFYYLDKERYWLDTSDFGYLYIHPEAVKGFSVTDSDNPKVETISIYF